jgi:hypothetical protein
MPVDCGSRNLEPAEPSPSGERYCSNCGLTKNAEGGYWKLFSSKLKRRWVCKQCAERRLKEAI